MIEVEIGDTIVEFPDGTSQEVMRNALRKRFGSPQQEQPTQIIEQPVSPYTYPDQAALDPTQDTSPITKQEDGVRDFYTRELSREVRNLPIIGGAVTAAEDIGLGVAQLVTNLGLTPETGEAINKLIQDREATIDPRGEVGRIAASMAIPTPLGKGGALQRVATGAGLGAATSPVILDRGQEDNLGEFIQQKAIQAGTGLATGGALEGAPRFSAAVRKLFKKPPPAMTSDEIRQASGALYKTAEEKGGTLSADTTNQFIQDIQSLKPQTEAGKLVTGESEFTKIVDRFNDLQDRNLTLAEAQELDEYLGEVIDGFTDMGKLTKQGKKIFDIQTSLRDTIENVGENSVIGGKEGFEALKEARKLWSRSRKLADVERIIQRAENMEQPATALKSGFRTLLNNPKRLRGFTEAEKKAIKRASESGVVQDIFRTFGSRLIPIVTGASTGGLGSTAAATLGSTASRSVGARIQADKAREVAETIARGGQELPAQQFPQVLSSGDVSGITRGAATAMQGEPQEPSQPQTTFSPEAQELLNSIRSLRTGQQPSAQQPQTQEGSLLDRIAQAESGGNPDAKARTSSASGLFQITDGTWRSLVNKYGKQEGIKIAQKNDPRAQRIMTQRLLDENTDILSRSLKRVPTDGELYIAHFAGPATASRLIKNKDRDITARSLVPKAVYNANKSVFRKRNGKQRTASEVYDFLTNKVA